MQIFCIRLFQNHLLHTMLKDFLENVPCINNSMKYCTLFDNLKKDYFMVFYVSLEDPPFFTLHPSNFSLTEEVGVGHGLNLSKLHLNCFIIIFTFEKFYEMGGSFHIFRAG